MPGAAAPAFAVRHLDNLHPMRATPTPLPEWLTSYRQPPYRNIYEICPQERFVFGTESLYGDWDAELLILAQDVGPADEFEKLRDAGHPHPFAHREFRPGFPRYDPAAGMGGAGTNKTIFRLAEHVSCTKLYGSALIGMCRPGADYHGTLPRPTLVRDFCVRVLRWAIDPERMPKLRAVICLGNLAEDHIRRAIREEPTLASGPRLFHTPHPAARGQIGSYNAVLPVWREMAKQMGWAFSGD